MDRKYKIWWMLTARNEATEATSDEYVSGNGRRVLFWAFFAVMDVAGLIGARGERLGALVASVAAGAFDPAMSRGDKGTSWDSNIDGCAAAGEQWIQAVVERQN